MASKEERDDGSDEEEVEDKSKNAKAQQAALKTLNRDDDAGKAVDNAQAAKALSALSAPSVKAAQDEAQRKELAAVAIKQEDLDLIIRELDVSKDKAELVLRQQKGDVVQALRTLLAQ